jgi:hypothetical protein
VQGVEMQKLLLFTLVSLQLLFLTNVNASSSILASYHFLGNAEDSSGNANDGTVYGAQLTTDRFGNENSAYTFDGMDDYIDIGALLDGKRDFTLRTWIKTLQQTQGSSRYQDPAIIGVRQQSGTTNDFLLSNYNGYMGWYDEFGATNTYVYPTVSIADDEWHQLAVVRSNTTLSFYLDGQKVGMDTTGDWPVSGQNIDIGRSLWSGSLYFAGDIDEIFVYEGNLTESEIAALYADESPFSGVNQRITVPTFVTSDFNVSAVFPTTSNTLTYSILTSPTHGTATISGNLVSYTPAEGYSGMDSFTFVAHDGAIESEIGTVSINVSGVTLDGLRWELPCVDTNPGPGSCAAVYATSSHSGVVGGVPGREYILNLRFRGVVEQNTYSGGVKEGYWYIGGTPSDPSFNIYKLEISDPQQYYYLNAGTAGIYYTWLIDYVKRVRVKGGATVTLSLDTADGRLITNYDQNGTPIVIPDIPPAPNAYNGQFLQLDLESVSTGSGWLPAMYFLLN